MSRITLNASLFFGAASALILHVTRAKRLAFVERIRVELEKKVQERTAELSRANAFVEQVLDHVPNMIFVKEAKELRFVRFNKAGEELLGFKNEELLGKNDYDFFPKSQADFFTAIDRAVLEKGRMLDIPEEPIQTRHKGQRILHTKKIPVTDPSNQASYLIGISEDITELKKLTLERERQEALVLSAERINALIQHSMDAVVGMDESGNVTTWNPQAEVIFEISRADALNKKLSDLIIPKRFRGIHEDWLSEFLKSASPHLPTRRIEQVGLRGNGKEFPLEITTTAISQDGGWNFYAFIRDISDRKKMEERQKELFQREHRAREAAEQASVLKTKFLDIAAHELRTPVTAFSLLLEVTQRQLAKGEPVKAETLTRLRAQTARISRLVVDLLDVSRLERGITTLSPSKTDLIALVSNCLREFQLLDPTRPFSFHNGTKKESLELEIDSVRINQVLSNLLDNAVKYTPKEAPIKIEVCEFATKVRVAVTDHGSGIPEKHREELFSAFSRGASDLVTKTSGLGLGLYICRGIIDLHHGHIGVISQEGKGSTFYFELPKNEIIRTETPSSTLPSAHR